MVAWVAVLWLLGTAAAVVSDIARLRGAASIAAARQVETTISLGVANAVTVRLRNRGGGRYEIVARDEPPPEFGSESPRATLELSGGETAEYVYRVTPPKRGNYAFGDLTVRAATPRGLLLRQATYRLRRPVRVYPNLLQTRAHELLTRRDRLIQMGVRLSRLRGTGLEFESLRDYVPGDEMRRIDWKATARRDEPVTREYDLERSQHVLICLDLGRTMASQLGVLTKMDHAVNASTLLAYAALKTGDWVGLFLFGERPLRFIRPRRTTMDRILAELYPLGAEAVESSYYRAFIEISRRLRKRSLIVLFTDLLDPDSSARLIRHVSMLARRHLVLCVAVSDYELEGIAEASPERPRDLYQRTVALSLLHDRRLAVSALRERGVIVVDARPSDLSVQVLNRYLDIKERARL